MKIPFFSSSQFPSCCFSSTYFPSFSSFFPLSIPFFLFLFLSSSLPLFFNFFIYVSNCVSIATPRFIQCFCLCSAVIGTLINITKFVEWPVVDKVPCLKEVLYTGQLYTWAVPWMCPVYCSGIPSINGTFTFSLGARWMYGISINNSL